MNETCLKRKFPESSEQFTRISCAFYLQRIRNEMTNFQHFVPSTKRARNLSERRLTKDLKSSFAFVMKSNRLGVDDSRFFVALTCVVLVDLPIGLGDGLQANEPLIGQHVPDDAKEDANTDHQVVSLEMRGTNTARLQTALSKS